MPSYNPIATILKGRQPMPIKDRSLYPRCWHQISRYIRNVRAGRKCEWCGARNHEPHPMTGSVVVLTVAHLDHDPRNNYMENLAALCQKCHNNYDREKRARNAKNTRYTNRHKYQLVLISNEGEHHD